MAAGVYLHIPFCKSRCSYCDFATDVYRSDDAVQRYVNALCREIKLDLPALAGGKPAEVNPNKTNSPAAYAAGSDIDTIYFGGGTPSLLAPKKVERSEEHTSELQSQSNLVCRLLLEKKKLNMKEHR